MVHRTWIAGAFVLATIPLTLWLSTPSSVSAQDRPAQTPSPTVHVVLPWGGGYGQVGLRPEAYESPADGPSAVALAADGSIVLLDRINERLVRLDRDGRVRGTFTMFKVPPDAEDIAIAKDGAVGVFSPLRARFWVHEGTNLVGEVPVPRELRELLEVGFGPSRQVVVRSAHQETYRLGPPSAPQTLAAVLHSKQEGAFQLPDGTGMAARLDGKKRPEILILDNSGERTRVVRKLPVHDDPVMSVRILGIEDGITCVRIEHEWASPNNQVRVRRSVTCLTTTSGTKVFERDLGTEHGIYNPRRSFGMGGQPLRLSWIQPKKDGLHIHGWDVPRMEQGGTL